MYRGLVSKVSWHGRDRRIDRTRGARLRCDIAADYIPRHD